MANVHNELTRFTELSRAYKNALGLGEGGLERAGETLTPTMPLFERPEWALHRDELLGVVPGYIAAGGAGNYGGIAIACPSGSDQLVVVEPESFGLVSGASTEVLAYINTQTAIAGLLGGAAIVPVSRDSRNWSTAGTSRINVSTYSGTSAAALGSLMAVLNSNATTHIQTCAVCAPIVLSPGWGFALRSGTANVGFYAYIKFRVRRAMPGELGK